MDINKYYLNQNVWFLLNGLITIDTISAIKIIDNKIAYGFKRGKNNYFYKNEKECYETKEELLGLSK